MNFVYELDEKGTSLFNNKKNPVEEGIHGRFEFKLVGGSYI